MNLQYEVGPELYCYGLSSDHMLLDAKATYTYQLLPGWFLGAYFSLPVQGGSTMDGVPAASRPFIDVLLTFVLPNGIL